MLTNQQMVYFAPETWDGLWRNRQQLMSVFAQHHNQVLFVEGRHTLKSIVSARRRGGLSVWAEARPRLRQVADNLHVFRYPIWTPASRRPPLTWWANIVGRGAFRAAMRTLGMAEPIVWFSRPGMLEMLPQGIAPSLRIYHVVDEYAAYLGNTAANQERVARLEKHMMKGVDVVLVVSAELYRTKRPYHAHTYLVPNGVNYHAYAAALAEPGLPPDLNLIPSPRLGYSGLIGERLDLNLFADLAKRHPQWSIVLIGEARLKQQAVCWQELKGLGNVHYLGPKAVTEVPHYLKGFDVGLMPYQQSRESDHISPLKLYDYLAAGLPIAAMAIPAMHEFASHVHIAARPEQFVQAVRQALADTSAPRREARRAVASQQTWKARAERISDLLQRHLPGVSQEETVGG